MSAFPAGLFDASSSGSDGEADAAPAANAASPAVPGLFDKDDDGSSDDDGLLFAPAKPRTTTMTPAAKPSVFGKAAAPAPVDIHSSAPITTQPAAVARA